MKAPLLAAMAFCLATPVFAQMPALPDETGIIYISPANADGESPLTIRFFPAASCEAGTASSLENAPEVHLHAGGMDDQYNWVYAHDWDASGNPQATLLTPNGDGSYSITITPRDYFPFGTNVPVGQIKGFKLVFNGGNSTPSPWDRQAHARPSSGSACNTDMAVYFPLPGAITSVASRTAADFRIQIHPNPTTEASQIRYRLPAEGRVSITIRNLLGSEIERLFEGVLARGDHEVYWKAEVPAGLYFCTVSTAAGSHTVRIMVRQ